MPEIHYQDALCVKSSNIVIPSSSRPDFESCYVFAFPKAGSVLVNQVTRALMMDIGVPVVDLPQYAFDNGIRMENIICNIDDLLKDFGYCYSGFRSLPPFLCGLIGAIKQKKILVVRDPRDMLVSLYYSMKYSHKLEESGTSSFKWAARILREETNRPIDDYCLFHSASYNHIFYGYFELLNDRGLRILRYEDFIYDKADLAFSICDWFGIDLPADRRQAIAASFDCFPPEERPFEHLRQAHPGDHKRKLQPKTIEVLNAVFTRFLATFGYSS